MSKSVYSGNSDVRRYAEAVLRGWALVVVSAAVGGLVAFGVSSVQTPEYRSIAVAYVTSGNDDNSAAAYQGSLASEQRVSSYTKLVSADAVVEQALRLAPLNLSAEEVASKVSATSTPDTVLLNISALDTSPDRAAQIANAVAQAMAAYVARIETPSGGGQPLAKLTLVTPAKTSATAETPKTVRNVILGIVTGLLIGFAGVLVRARFSNRIRFESDLSGDGWPAVVASVPTDSGLKARGLIDFGSGGTPAAEAFRKLRTNLAFTNVDHPPRVILVSSAVAVEGKTTTAMNLAAAMVEAGKRVVLVDADLRRPQIDTRAGLVGEVGFTNFMRGDGSLNVLVQPTQVDGLWILASGPKPPNPAELLGSQRASDALRELAGSFDYVVVDSPPVLPVTDAVVLAQWADGVLLVARAGSTKIPDLADAYVQISNTQTPVIGFVLTEAPTDKSRYGYYAVKPKQGRSIFGRNREPKAIEDVLEPKRTSKH